MQIKLDNFFQFIIRFAKFRLFNFKRGGQKKYIANKY